MVSIIMPCYNAGKYIREAIESVVNQTYQDWELIIINDGSTDNSQQVVKEYIHSAICNSRNGDQSSIRLINQPNSGACRARNNGIEHANGEYIKFLDADDILLPNALQDQVEQIAKLGPKQIPFGDYINVDEKGKPISEYHFNNQQLLSDDSVYFFFCEWRVLITCPLHRTKLLREIGGFNEQLKRGQESDLHLRLALADVEWMYYPTMLFKYRDYVANQRISCYAPVNTRKRVLCSEQRMIICEQLFLDKYGTMPTKYRTYFRNGWFSKARREFAARNNDGKSSIQKSQVYGPMSAFQRFYILMGKCIGYINLERIFQIRLRVLGKN